MAKAISAVAECQNTRQTINPALKSGIRRLIFYTLLLALWQAIAISGVWPDYLFPGPSGVFNSLVNGFQNGLFLQATLVSLQRLITGYAISTLVGLTLGLLIGRFRIVEETVGSLVLGLQALPSVCWIPLALLWFGLKIGRAHV